MPDAVERTTGIAPRCTSCTATTRQQPSEAPGWRWPKYAATSGPASGAIDGAAARLAAAAAGAADDDGTGEAGPAGMAGRWKPPPPSA